MILNIILRKREVKIMGQFNRDDIAAIRCSDGVICVECATDEEMIKLASQDDIIDTEEADNTEDYIFCDRCKKRIA